MSKPKQSAMAVILFHMLVSALHSIAHVQLEVWLSLFGNLYVGLVITLTPLIALIFLWRGLDQIGAWLLLIAMTGALCFGIYHHFIYESPDHVLHLPAGDHTLFQITAVLVALTEAAGIVIAWWMLRHSSKEVAI